MAVSAQVPGSLLKPFGYTPTQQALAIAACLFASAPAFASDLKTLERLGQQKQYMTMLQMVDSVLAKDKQNLPYVNYRIQALNGLKRWQDVVDTAKAYGYLCKTTEDRVSFTQMSGNANMNMHRYAEAEKDFDSCVKLDPKNKDRDLIWKGDAQLRQCKRIEAAKTFLSADRSKLSIGEIDWRHRFLLILGKNAEALKDIDDCIRVDPKNPMHQYAKVYVLARLNDRNRAVSLCKHLIESTASKSMLHKAAFTGLQEIQAISGNNIKSVTRLDIIDPRYGEALALIHRSEYALLEGRKKEGLDLLSEAIKIQPFSGFTIARRAKALMEEMMLKEALADANLAVARETDNPEAHVTRAKILVQMNRLEEALEDWVTATNLAPIGDNFYESAKFCVQLKRPDEALKYIDLAVSLLPQRLKFYLTKGEALSEKRDFKGAISIYTDILNSRSIDTEPVVKRDAFSARAKAYRQIGKTALAEADEKQVNSEHSYLFDNAPFREYDHTMDGARKNSPTLPLKKNK